MRSILFKGGGRLDHFLFAYHRMATFYVVDLAVILLVELVEFPVFGHEEYIQFCVIMDHAVDGWLVVYIQILS